MIPTWPKPTKTPVNTVALVYFPHKTHLIPQVWRDSSFDTSPCCDHLNKVPSPLELKSQRFLKFDVANGTGIKTIRYYIAILL